ncbi:MAG: hypothetical protein HDT13_11030 [Butyrivibrio sp.]|nr:hypothetical protein [Butyrivibrio sp.]
MKKSKRSLVLFSCIIAIAVYTGCSKGDSNDKDVEINDVNYAKGSKKIYVNLLKEYADFTNVAFYDFYNDRKITSYSGNVIRQLV